jgi:maltooligosyltrehalose trehalohydrolase
MIATASTHMAEAPLGANRRPTGEWEFVLWAPHSQRVQLHILGSQGRLLDMHRDERGYHYAVIEFLKPGTQYLYRLEDSRELPDPASRFQPEGVHGPSQLVDTGAFKWTNQDWTGVPLERSIFYELHVGTYTTQGTFDALIPHLPDLVALGITTVELMPIAQFPGARNWGYDGVFPCAPQNTYGGPEALVRFVNSAHANGLAVALDVVYNHLGPEGNYLGVYGPYFTDRYRTPWGDAINFDGRGSDEVRRFFRENALSWLETYHFDALRLDAIDTIFDLSARHFLAELKSAVKELSARSGRQIHLVAESDLNDSRIILPAERGGFDLDAQWGDDFHHSLHVLLTQESNGYYQDFGSTRPLATTLRDGWYYSGQYSRYRRRRHGNSPRGISRSHFVVCSQNHDQVGNRAAGERLTALVDFEALKLAAGVSLLSPFVPLLFMGEEYGETAPFQYFTSHLDAGLVAAVRHGRREEFAAFGWEGLVPDPQDEATFRRSKLQHQLRENDKHATLLHFYQELIRLRKEHHLGGERNIEVRENGDWVLLRYEADKGQGGEVAIIFNFASSIVNLDLPELNGRWEMKIASSDAQWRGPNENPTTTLSKPFALQLHPHSFIVFEPTPAASESM